MEMAYSNVCHYCVPAHRQVARNLGVDHEMIERVTRGETLEGDARPAVIQRLARRLVATRGKLTDEEFRSFQDQGVTVPQMIAAVAEIAHRTLQIISTGWRIRTWTRSWSGFGNNESRRWLRFVLFLSGRGWRGARPLSRGAEKMWEGQHDGHDDADG